MGRRRPATIVAIGVAAGVGSAYLNSLPTWDDSGILAGGMLVASGGLTLAGGRPPWLVALAVGMWIPARAIVAGGDPRLAAVMIFAFLGAYAGTLVRAAVTGPAISR